MLNEEHPSRQRVDHGPFGAIPIAVDSRSVVAPAVRKQMAGCGHWRWAPVPATSALMLTPRSRCVLVALACTRNASATLSPRSMDLCSLS